MTDDLTMRRQPRQARSQQRVDHVLDTAARLFSEIGYEAATTNLLAARAGISIGSLYQFFPNKEAVLEALIGRYTTALRQKIAEVMTPAATEGLPLSAVIAQIVLAMGRLEAEHVGFRQVFMREDLTAAQQIHHEIISAITATLLGRFPGAPAGAHERAAMVMVRMVKGLMGLTEPPDHVPPEVMADEMMLALLAYLRAWLRRQGLPVPADLEG